MRLFASHIAERMQIIEDVLSGSKRAFEELQANLSKVRALQAVAAHVMEDVERDADEASNNRNNCSDGVRATFFSNPFFRGPPAGYQDDATIDLKVEGSSPFPGVPVQSFSVRWDGYLVPTVSDRYRLFTYADCGIRVFLDDSPIIVDRMPAPEESAAFSEDPVQPLPPSGFTGVAKIFSSPQARAVLGWTSNTLPEQTIPPENYFQSDSPPLLKIAGLPGNDYDLSTLDDGQLAFIDSGSHFIADVPAYYRGLRLLRTQKHPKNTTVHFEVSAECVVFVGVPRGAVPPSASQQLVFQPVKFAAVDNAISIYFASSRDVRRTLVVTTAVCVLPHRIELQVKASEQQRFSIYSARILPGLVAFDVPPGAPVVVSLTRAPTFETCSQSSALSRRSLFDASDLSSLGE
ncbi:PA14 domain-containing protein [Cyclospora cayetanensis]|uniref:PA14 domain-containing protein n=1 Tax=Cyclospora cayetanensis TaxID=88456 RepID=A0A1D3D7L6_9EIME|nr:PA14 domain-containing protein [Cyclospora cayetanensis]